jgi:hypothetical protein
VQGQLLVTGAPYCEFIVNTKEDFAVSEVFPHRKVQSKMFDKLNFTNYMQYHIFKISVMYLLLQFDTLYHFGYHVLEYLELQQLNPNYLVLQCHQWFQFFSFFTFS